MSRYIKLPDAVFNFNLNATELMVYTALQKHANIFGRCIVKHSTIAQLIGASTGTVSRATRALESKGLIFIHACRNKKTGDQIANGYTLESFTGGYTKLPANIHAYKLPKSVFKVYVYFLKCRCEKSLQAVPSLSQMVSVLHMSKRTVIDAVNYLQERMYLSKERYERKTDNRIGHNRHIVFTPVLRAIMLRLVCALNKAQKRIRATLFQRVARIAKNYITKSIYSILNTYEIVKHIAPKILFYLVI
ncbi:helix-turn-helix domain-containing protein [Hydrogenoanaerobacterium sp.]|uniref:helix-turn-helix domain-containing protein n=1 Tax=Hydrogenoanaerobacterium sp. TaxID=2953763 RepID=UPI00289B611D|nr:helix-turn-helix domain-containing protein [Hydrogenoanaerobacterium sp.]